MLELRPGCECCDRDLDPLVDVAMICTYECTWCVDCARDVHRGVCPNCGGELVRRPVPSARRLVQHPPTATRTVAADCLAARR